MATWNTLTRPVYGGPAQQPDFFNRSKTNSVRQLSLAKVPSIWSGSTYLERTMVLTNIGGVNYWIHP